MCDMLLVFPATQVLVTMMTEMKAEIRDVKDQLAVITQMIQAQTSASHPDVTEDLGVDLPVADIDILDSLDQQLSQDAQFRKSLVSIAA